MVTQFRREESSSPRRPPERTATIKTDLRQREGWAMDFFFFFAGLFCTIVAIVAIKKTSPNR